MIHDPTPALLRSRRSAHCGRSQVRKPCKRPVEMQLHSADRAVALLADNHVGKVAYPVAVFLPAMVLAREARLTLARTPDWFALRVVIFLAIDEQHHVR